MLVPNCDILPLFLTFLVGFWINKQKCVNDLLLHVMWTRDGAFRISIEVTLKSEAL